MPFGVESHRIARITSMRPPRDSLIYREMRSQKIEVDAQTRLLPYADWIRDQDRLWSSVSQLATQFYSIYHGEHLWITYQELEEDTLRGKLVRRRRGASHRRESDQNKLGHIIILLLFDKAHKLKSTHIEIASFIEKRNNEFAGL